MNVRKVLVGSAAVVLLSGLVSGCGQSKPPAAPPPGAPKESEMKPPAIDLGTPMQTGADKTPAGPAAKK